MTEDPTKNTQENKLPFMYGFLYRIIQISPENRIFELTPPPNLKSYFPVTMVLQAIASGINGHRTQYDRVTEISISAEGQPRSFWTNNGFEIIDGRISIKVDELLKKSGEKRR